MIVTFLLSGGCQGIAKRDLQRLIHSPVCPVCKAVSIDECHCFRAIESAGYCETSWASLDPTVGTGPYERGGLQDRKELPIEELPTPQAVLSPQAEDMHCRVPGSQAVTDGAQPVAHWNFASQSPPRGGQRGASRHFADEAPLPDQE